MEAERRRYFKKEGAINCIERCCYIGLGLRTHRGFGACHITGGLGRNSLVGRWGRMQERMRRTRVDRLLFGVKGMIFLKMRSISASLRSDGNERTEKDNFRIQGKKKKKGANCRNHVPEQAGTNGFRGQPGCLAFRDQTHTLTVLPGGLSPP